MFNRTFPTVAVALVIAACSDDLPTGIKPSSTPTTMAIQSGDGQTATVARSLADPLVAHVTDARGRPVRNANVWFEIVSGGGVIVGRTSVLTDSAGQASAIWRLGTSTTIEQVAKARVLTSSGAPAGPEVAFHANILPDRALSVEIPIAGEAIGPVPEFTRTVTARAYDLYHNPVPGTTVRWSAPMAGTLDAEETVTGPDGSAENQWTVRASSGAGLGAGAYWMTAAIAIPGVSQDPTALYSVTVGDARLAATSLAIGEIHSCAVADAGQIYCWGDNSFGQLGDGGRVSRPFAVRAVTGTESFTQVVAGRAHTCALTTTGTTYCWGANGEAQLGDGTRTSRLTAAPVEQPAKFVSLTAGTWHTCGLTGAGVAYCWGSNVDGQLGDGSTTGRPLPNEVAAGSARFASLTAGADHTCGLTTDDRTLCWGNDEAGQIGSSVPGTICRARCITVPTLVDGDFVDLTAGMQYTCGIERAGTAWCWGGHLASRTKVESGLAFTDLIGGRSTGACGITDDGRAFCWSFYYDYYYYYSDQAELTSPQPVGGVHLFSALGLGEADACGLERGESGWVVCWSFQTQPGSPPGTEPAYIQRAGQP
jgi:hypothetical protein